MNFGKECDRTENELKMKIKNNSAQKNCEKQQMNRLFHRHAFSNVLCACVWLLVCVRACV